MAYIIRWTSSLVPHKAPERLHGEYQADMYRSAKQAMERIIAGLESDPAIKGPRTSRGSDGYSATVTGKIQGGVVVVHRIKITKPEKV